MVALVLGDGLLHGGVGAGAGLGQGESAQLLAGEQAGQILLLLLLGAELADRPAAQGGMGGYHDGGGGAVLGQLLADADVGHVAQAGPAVLLGEGDAHHAHLGQLVPGLLGETLVLVHVRSQRGNLFYAEIMQHVQNFLLFFFEMKIHNRSPSK